MARDHARSIPDLRGRPSPDLLRFTRCRRKEQAFELTQPGVRHTIARSIRSRFETSDLRPDESTTNIGLFKAGTGSILEHIDQPLLTLVERERAGHAHLIPHRPLERVR